MAAQEQISLTAPSAESLGHTVTGEYDQGIHYQISRDRNLYHPDAHLIKDFRQYAAGEHNLNLSANQKVILEGLLAAKFCDNVSHQIISEANDRIGFQEWTCEDEGADEWLEDLYAAAQLLDRSSEIHYDTLRDGNHAVAVNFDNECGEVCIYREPWWDGVEGVFVAYDTQDKPLYAVKDWWIETSDLGTLIRRVIYFKDRLERWVSQAGGAEWQPYLLPEDNGQWPLPWIDTDGSPLGIPYIHFKNSGRGTGNYGSSELTGGVLGFQNQINDLQYTASAAARYNGFKIITIAGIELELDPEDPTGKKTKIPDMGPGGVLSSPNKDTVFDSIEPGSLQAIVDAYMMKLKALSRMTRTPLHSITGGDWPSGEALARSEAPAVGKADRQVKKFSDCWTQVAVMAVKIRNRFSLLPRITAELAGGQISCRFANTERRDPLSKSMVVNYLRNGVNGAVISKEESLRLMGYNEAQAEQIIEELEAETAAEAAAEAIRFSRGVGMVPAAGTSPQESSTEEEADADPLNLPSILNTNGSMVPPPVGITS